MCALPLRRARRQPRTDFVEGMAVSASFLCLVHCLALPLLLLALPILVGTVFESDVFHILAAALVVPAAALAFLLGYRRHRTASPALLGAVGVVCIVAALLPGWSEGAASAITVAGSLVLIGGHVVNWRLRRTLAR